MRKFGLVLLLAALGAAPAARAQVSPAARPFVHGLFTDNMVLQRDVPCPVWGWAQPGQRVTVSISGQSASAIAGPDGRWLTRVGPLRAGGPFELKITGPSALALKNVMVGDVWICSGQSNMQMGMKGITEWWNEQGNADLPGLRLAVIPPASGFQMPNSVHTSWRASSKGVVFSDELAVGGFSAIAWLFGRQIHQETGVPVGLVEVCWGATDAAAWSSPGALPSLAYAGDDFNAYRERVEQAWEKMDPAFASTSEWNMAAFDDAGWPEASLPHSGESGVNWYRRQVDIPAAWAGRDLIVSLGPIDEIDTLWWDGTWIDSHSVVDNMMSPRFYRIPGSLVKAGPHTLALRVLGRRGLFGKPGEIYLQQADDEAARVSLSGPWRTQRGTPESGLRRGSYPDRRVIGAGCFQAMLAPLAPFAIKGVIWYQGEGDVGRSGSYGETLTRLVRDWRGLFQQGDFPFYLVQISAFGPPADGPVESGWAEVREAQARVAVSVPNSGLAVSVDRGDITNIHPPNKQDVARRLARVALEKTYGKKVASAGPTFVSATPEGSALRVAFRDADGLVSKGGVPASFEIAGSDKKYVRAQAVIEGSTVLVSSAQVPHPISVRYGWADNPICNLYNAAGLPAVPFRSAP